MNKAYLLELRSDPRFQALVNEVLSKVPIIPGYNPANDNTEDWKFESGCREGYIQCMTILGMEINND